MIVEQVFDCKGANILNSDPPQVVCAERNMGLSHGGDPSLRRRWAPRPGWRSLHHRPRRATWEGFRRVQWGRAWGRVEAGRVGLGLTGKVFQPMMMGMSADPTALAAELASLIEKARASDDPDVKNKANEANEVLQRILARHKLIGDALDEAQRVQADKLERLADSPAPT